MIQNNNRNNNTKKTGMKAAILMAALLAVGTPFAVYTYKAQNATGVVVSEVTSETSGKTVSGSKTASTKASQKSGNSSVVTEKTTTATTETAKGKSNSAKKKATEKTPTKADTYTVARRNMTVYATAKTGLNVRSAADASARTIGNLSYREAVKVTGQVLKNGNDTGWYRVSYNGSTGYIKADYVSTTQPAAPKKEKTSRKVVSSKTLSVTTGEEQRTVSFWSDGTITDNKGVSFTKVNDSLYKSSDGRFWCESHMVNTMILYPTEGSGIVDVTVFADGSIYDGNGVIYYQTTDTEYADSEGNGWTTKAPEEEEATENKEEAQKMEESENKEETENKAENKVENKVENEIKEESGSKVESETKAETETKVESENKADAETKVESENKAEAETKVESENKAEVETKSTVTMTVSVPDGYLALRNSANGDTDNEIAQLQNGETVEVNREDLNAGSKFVRVTVPSTGKNGYVDVEFLK